VGNLQAAHDIASLLTVSNGYRQQAEAMLAKARLADERAMELCRNMLAGNLQPAAGVFDLNVIVKELAMMQSVGLSLDCHDEALPVAGEALGMLRALLNLCMNAKKAGADEIRVTTERLGGNNARMVINDNGSGMAPDVVMKLWDLPMSQDGLHGRGLPIVKKTIDGLGGVINVRSAPGQGATFTICLPLWDKGTPDA